MIWKFDDSNVYVIGSVHVMSADGNSHTESINRIIDIVSRVVFETSLEFGELPITQYKHEKLSNQISKALFRDVKKKWVKYGLELCQLESSKIWNTAISISMQIFASIGLYSENGVDKILWNRSKERGLDIDWLEDQESGLACFDNSPIEEQQRLLTEAVRNKKKGIQVITEIIEGWNSADESRLLKVLEASLNEYPVLYNCLIVERNLQWVGKLLDSLKADKPTLFVVGALHCIGERSILNLLNEYHGYSAKLINT